MFRSTAPAQLVQSLQLRATWQLVPTPDRYKALFVNSSQTASNTTMIAAIRLASVVVVHAARPSHPSHQIPLVSTVYGQTQLCTWGVEVVSPCAAVITARMVTCGAPAILMSFCSPWTECEKCCTVTTGWWSAHNESSLVSNIHPDAGCKQPFIAVQLLSDSSLICYFCQALLTSQSTHSVSWCSMISFNIGCWLPYVVLQIGHADFSLSRYALSQ